MVNEFYLLTRSDLIDGIRDCISNSNLLLQKTERLLITEIDGPINDIEENSIALGLYIFALEEYGKALALLDYLQENQEKINVPRKIFYGKPAHKLKLNKAFTKLPQECVHFLPGVTLRFNTDYKTKSIPVTSKGDEVTLPGGVTGQFQLIDVNILADSLTRNDCFYVDWDDEKIRWKTKPSVLADDLLSAISKFKKIVQNMTTQIA